MRSRRRQGARLSTIAGGCRDRTCNNRTSNAASFQISTQRSAHLCLDCLLASSCPG